nr:putative ribonuclease H-like domain-containing protein [Tanacetum cinerariifolium]
IHKPDSFYHTEQKMALGYQNPCYLKQAQKKQQSLYDGKVLLEKHDPPVVHDSGETSQLKRIFRYLKGHPTLGLWYPKDSPLELITYSDSDYACASLDRKSTIEGCQILGSRLISWRCKKQTIVANSTTEAKYIAASSCCRQVIWLQNQLLDYD